MLLTKKLRRIKVMKMMNVTTTLCIICPLPALSEGLYLVKIEMYNGLNDTGCHISHTTYTARTITCTYINYIHIYTDRNMRVLME
uniref:Uncharacterized protein n=1 Tax=Octopus bimaculoides TaxID=37653 RepID=A0A0L8HGB7_OCTBM